MQPTLHGLHRADQCQTMTFLAAAPLRENCPGEPSRQLWRYARSLQGVPRACYPSLVLDLWICPSLPPMSVTPVDAGETFPFKVTDVESCFLSLELGPES